MRKKIISFSIFSVLIFIFVIFYKGIDKSGFYEPKSEIKDIPKFFAKSFYLKEDINSKKIFEKDKYYLFNIWASWCVPCRDEHPLLDDLSRNENLKIIGLNYKDKQINAEKFLDEFGNPFHKILLDQDGTIAIEWGGIGVPETFLIYKNKILKRYIGTLNQTSVLEIKKIIK